MTSKYLIHFQVKFALRLDSVNVEKRRVCPMKSKFLIVSLALCLMLGTYAQAYDCGCNDFNPCYANDCRTTKCDLFSGLKKLLRSGPKALNACGPCDAVVACAPCEPVAYVDPCVPAVACAPIACEPVYAACEPLGCNVGCFDSCYRPGADRPLLNAAKKTKVKVSKFFNGLFGSLKGCDCNLCRSFGYNACDPCVVSCDPCAPAVGYYNGYNNAMPGVPE
jgi:hypothetical protein